MILTTRQRKGLYMVLSSPDFKTSLALANEAVALRETLVLTKDEVDALNMTEEELNDPKNDEVLNERLSVQFEISDDLLGEIVNLLKLADIEKQIPADPSIVDLCNLLVKSE